MWCSTGRSFPTAPNGATAFTPTALRSSTAGHVGQALYTACTGLGLGTCGLGAFQHEKCCDLFGLDGEEEYIIYTAPVGTIRDEDLTEENAFYQFVEDEGL